MVEAIILGGIFLLTWYCVFANTKLSLLKAQIPSDNTVPIVVGFFHSFLVTILVYVFKFY